MTETTYTGLILRDMHRVWNWLNSKNGQLFMCVGNAICFGWILGWMCFSEYSMAHFAVCSLNLLSVIICFLNVWEKKS